MADREPADVTSRVPRVWALLIVFAAACGDPPPRAWREPQVWFPERPELDALVPARPWIMSQETWTDSSRLQHCREWALPRGRGPSAIEQARERLQGLGIEAASPSPDDIMGAIARVPGLDVVLTDPSYLHAGDESTGYPKFVVCTNDRAARAAFDAFAAGVRADPLYPSGAPFGNPYLYWRRHFTSGATQIGLYWMPAPGARAWLDGQGYEERRREYEVVWMDKGHATARLSSGSLWWDCADRPYP